ncbi:MAG: cyclic di-AMP binding protein CbpA [Streptococcaceae bacterium]|jgi:CBS domain-containing protein|nr:cyclic di-AMP binding protein CbpA [Streptococcaceae bacterium]
MLLLNTIVVRKEKLTTVSDTVSLDEALRVLEESGYRCVPILSEDGKKYKGNIYKMHIYRHKANGGDMNENVMSLMKNDNKFIYLTSNFYNVFFDIKDLPYIAVLNDNNDFHGILTHASLLNLLEDSWNIKEGKYVMTVASAGEKGDLAEMTKIISKRANLASCMTLDAGRDKYIRRTLFTLDKATTKEALDEITKKLEKKHYNVIEVEDLDA